jgi:hypothetical protein
MRCVALLIGAGKDDRVVEGGWLLERDIHPQWIVEARDEKLDLLGLRQGGVAAGERGEALGVLVHVANATQHGELADRAIGEPRPKASVDELHKLGPCGLATVKLHPVEPQLCIVQQVEGGEHHPLVLWCPVNMEVALASTEPGQGITGAIEFWKFEFVGRRGKVVARRGVVVVSPLPLARLSQRACGALRLGQTVNLLVQFQLMGGLILYSGLQHRDLVLQWL